MHEDCRGTARSALTVHLRRAGKPLAVNARRLIAVALLIAAGTTGCHAGEKAGEPAGNNPATTSPSVATTALDQLLLSAPDVNAAMATSGMTVTGTWTLMVETSSHIREKDCVFAYPGESSVYAVSGWNGVRRQLLSEPVIHSTHEVTQTVVSFPSPGDAARFFDSSALHWPACANRQYHHVSADDPDVLWTAGPVANADGMLSVTDTRSNDWVCQRALTVRGNIAADVAACAPGNPADAAVRIARQIVGRVATQ